ncbi:MAG TPA: cysteine--tRNA ligase, partial [candidate division Zixibacteria bacterium]|nr:cysteine--tRNA ligase [candidate division Zixibacteria bacterium]
LERYNDFIVNLKSYKGSESDNSAGAIIEKAKAGFEDALDDDLNVSGALGVVFDFIREINRIKADKNLSADERDNALDTINAFDSVLNFTYHINTDNTDSTEIESLIQQRADAKKNKDFVLADKIRADLLKQGIILEDSRDGTKWKKKV